MEQTEILKIKKYLVFDKKIDYNRRFASFNNLDFKIKFDQKCSESIINQTTATG